MKYIVTEKDKELLLQTDLNYKYRLYVVKDDMIIDLMTGLQGIGTYAVDSESKVRRTTSFTLFLEETYSNTGIEDKINFWIGYDFLLQIGVYDIREDDFVWYNCGTYTITGANTSYNAIENSLTLNLSDWWAKLNGERNGQMTGVPTIEIANETGDGENKVKTTIRASVTEVIKDAGIKKYIVADVGEFYGMEENNKDNFEEYRRLNPDWNILPYNLTFSGGCYVSEILEKYEGLYPNLQMYFDVYNYFCFDMIPSNEYSSIYIPNTFLQSILLADSSESVDYDISSIKNVTEVYGKTYEIERYSTDTATVTVDGNKSVYTIPISLYETYETGHMIRFTPGGANTQNQTYIQIKNTDTNITLDQIPLYYEFTENFVDANTFEADNTYVIKITRIKDLEDPKKSYFIAYYLGVFQPHAICYLTDGTDHSNDLVTLFANTENEVTVEKYSEEFFALKYNCDVKNVTKRVEKDSPFSVEKLGIVFEAKSGAEFDAIISDSVAVENSIYYNKKSSTTKDTITIQTKMIPWLDVQQKVSYKKQQDTEERQYIIKSVSHDLENMTSSITLYRFYPLYV